MRPISALATALGAAAARGRQRIGRPGTLNQQVAALRAQPGNGRGRATVKARATSPLPRTIGRRARPATGRACRHCVGRSRRELGTGGAHRQEQPHGRRRQARGGCLRAAAIGGFASPEDAMPHVMLAALRKRQRPPMASSTGAAVITGQKLDRHRQERPRGRCATPLPQPGAPSIRRPTALPRVRPQAVGPAPSALRATTGARAQGQRRVRRPALSHPSSARASRGK